MTYRETLWPNPLTYLAFFLEVPIIILLLAPFSLPLGIGLATVIFVIIAIALTATSPRIEVSASTLRVGKAVIGLEYLGAASAFVGPPAIAERGPQLDARAWTRFRAWINPVAIQYAPANRTRDRVALVARRQEVVARLLAVALRAHGSEFALLGQLRTVLDEEAFDARELVLLRRQHDNVQFDI